MRSRTKKKPLASRAIPSRLPPWIVVRMFLLASVAVVGCIWALVRFYRHPRAPMMTPAPNVQAPPEDQGEIPAPPLVPVD